MIVLGDKQCFAAFLARLISLSLTIVTIATNYALTKSHSTQNIPNQKKKKTDKKRKQSANEKKVF